MNTKQPLFTVATITYNSGKWVKQTIESILASSFTDFEYLISDDCSTDDTWEVIQQYTDPRIRAWRNENNLGEYPNRNKVLNEAKGNFIFYIDGDDILYKDSLATSKRFIDAFPGAKSIWGVYTVFFDFIVFPYQIEPPEITKLNFLSSYPLSNVGLAETIFDVQILKEIGGFNTKYAIGDIYIKRRLACEYPVLLVPAGSAFWRQTSNQASKKVKTNYRQLTDHLSIDKQLTEASYFPLKGNDYQTAVRNLKIRTVKLVFSNTIMKLKILDFFKLLNVLKILPGDLRYLFLKGDYNYKMVASGDAPLVNDYNFK